MKGMSVAPTRHLADSLGKRAAEKFGSSDNDGSIRETMATLSAHSEQTSDAKYGNHAESMVFDLSGQDMDKYKLCARLFNDMVGITVPCEATPSRNTAGLMPTPPTMGRRMQKLQFTGPLAQTTSGGFQWPSPGCTPLSGIDETDASGVDCTEDLDLLRADFKQSADDDKAAGQKRSAGDFNDSPAILPALQMPSLIARSGAAEPLALPTVPRTPLPRVPIAGPAADGAPLVTVTDFAFQADVIRLLTQANRKEGDCNTISNSCGRSTSNTCHRRELAGHSANIKR